MKPNQIHPANSSAPKVVPPSAGPESAPTLTAPVVPPAPSRPQPSTLNPQPPILSAILAGARDALGHALRVMIANQLPEGDGGRRLTENAFEAAKNLCQTPGKISRKDVAEALAGLTVAVGYLANHSLRLPEDLNTARANQQRLAKLAEQYDTLTAPAA